MNLFKELSFDIFDIEKVTDEDSVNRIKMRFQVDEKFDSYNLEDICTTSLKIMLRKKDI